MWILQYFFFVKAVVWECSGACLQLLCNVQRAGAGKVLSEEKARAGKWGSASPPDWSKLCFPSLPACMEGRNLLLLWFQSQILESTACPVTSAWDQTGPLGHPHAGAATPVPSESVRAALASINLFIDVHTVFKLCFMDPPPNCPLSSK